MSPRCILAALPGGAILLLVLAGCSGTTVAETAAAPSSSSTPIPSAAADLRPWASVVSQESARLAEEQSKLDDLSCSAGSAGGMPCSALYVAESFDLQTVQANLASLTTSGAQGFIAEAPPAEIASLYSDTSSVAATATEAAADWQDRCSSSTSIKCHGIAFQMTQAIDALSSQFDAWQPYL